MVDETPAVARRVARRLFLGSLCLYLLTAGGSLSSTDATVMFDLTQNIVERHSVALSGNLLGLEPNRGRDGRFYSQYGLGQSLYNIPFYLLGTAARDLVGRPIGKADTIPKAVVALGNTVAAAGVVAVVWLFAFHVTGAARASFVAAASVAIASPLWPYSKFGFSVPLATLLLVGAAYHLWRAMHIDRPQAAALAGALTGMAWLTRHEFAVVLLPFTLFVLTEGRRRGAARLPWHLLGLWGGAAAGGALWGAYNWIRFGSVTFVGYAPWFTGEGYPAFLFAPAGAVVLFCPIALAWAASLVRGRFTAGEYLLLAGPIVCFYVLYGALHDWMGGRSYGPRYLVPGLVLLAPALAVAVSVSLGRFRKSVLALIALSSLIQLPGVLVDYSKVGQEWAATVSREVLDDRAWRWAASPLVINTRAALQVVPDNVRYVTGRASPPAPPPAGGDDDRTFAQRFAFSVDFWWAYLMYLGVLPRTAALGLALTLIVATGLFGARAYRAAVEYDGVSPAR